MGHATIGGHIWAAVSGDNFYKLLDHLVGNERVAQVHFSNVGLSVCDLSEGLEDLLGGVLIFSDLDHKADKLLKGDAVAAVGGRNKVLVHLIFAKDKA